MSHNLPLRNRAVGRSGESHVPSIRAIRVAVVALRLHDASVGVEVSVLAFAGHADFAEADAFVDDQHVPHLLQGKVRDRRLPEMSSIDAFKRGRNEVSATVSCIGRTSVVEGEGVRVPLLGPPTASGALPCVRQPFEIRHMANGCCLRREQSAGGNPPPLDSWRMPLDDLFCVDNWHLPCGGLLD